MMFLRRWTGAVSSCRRLHSLLDGEQAGVVLSPHLLTRAQCELLISRRSTQYPIIGLPLSLGSFQVTNMLVAVMSSIWGLSGASGGSKM